MGSTSPEEEGLIARKSTKIFSGALEIAKTALKA
jgi:hypothetical protein